MTTAPTVSKVEALDDRVVDSRRSKATIGSFILVAVIFFIALDVTARLTFKYWSIDHFNSPNRSWIWWAVRDFQAQKEKPQIVLMGSSLMVMALHGGDATYLQFPQNNVLHHRGLLFEKMLESMLHKRYSTFAFAIAGQMVSDAYSICSCCLDYPRKPDYIIYGIAPRDFMDNTLPNPASTETFKYLSRVSDLSQIAMRARPSIWDRFDYFVGNVSFLYAHRADLLYLQHHYARVLFARLNFMDDLDLAKTPIELRKIAMMELPEDDASNEVFTGPYKPSEKYLDNSNEYRSRYRQFNRKLFDEQRSYLSDMMNICDKRKIKLIIVNMPVTAGNLQLMPPGFYDQYMQTVQSMSAAHSDHFIDLNNPKVFKDDCFMDSVHLNGKGGVKFFEKLAVELAKTQALTK